MYTFPLKRCIIPGNHVSHALSGFNALLHITYINGLLLLIPFLSLAFQCIRVNLARLCGKIRANTEEQLLSGFNPQLHIPYIHVLLLFLFLFSL